MRIGAFVILVGAIVAAFGLLFQFQGRGNIGPEASFMYQSSEWIDYGLGIAASGFVIIAIGIFLIRR